MAARPETDPKGKKPRPSASKDELEQYGVWVKAEPQDIAVDLDASAESGDEFTLPEEGISPEEESFLTAEEERLLGSFDDMDAEKSVDSPSIPDLDSDFSSLPDIEDFETSDIGMPEPEMAKKSGESPGASDDLSMDFSLDDLDSGYSQPSISPSSELDMASVEGFDAQNEPIAESDDFLEADDFDLEDEDELALDLSEEPDSKTGANVLGPELEDVSADFLDMGLGTTAKPSGAGTSASSAHDVTDEFLLDEDRGAESQAGARKNEETDFEPLDIDLQFHDTLPGGDNKEHAEAGFEEIDDFDDFLGEGKEDKALSDFDDLAALEKELSGSPAPSAKASPPASIPAAVPPPQSPPPSSEPSLANELLLKIANELASIRSELVTLKSQMGTMRVLAEEAPAPAALPEQEEESAVGGFFDDEDDEKIALTGDELDNILNSADFTEEAPPIMEGESLDFDALSDAEDLHSVDGVEALGQGEDHILDEMILPENGDYSAGAAAEEPVQRISLDDEDHVASAVTAKEETTEGMETLLKIADEGIMPLTDAPEDTSYLEEPLATEELDLGETDFAEAPLVEPDLSNLSVDLPLDADDMDLAEESLPDIALDIETSPESNDLEAGSLESSFDDVAIPEFEDSEYEEISLATESSISELDMLGEETETVEEFVEFIDEEIPAEEAFQHEKAASGSAEAQFAEAENEEETLDFSDLSAPQVTLSENLDDDLFVSKPSAAEDEAGIHLSSRSELGKESAGGELAEDFELPELDESEVETAASENAPLPGQAQEKRDLAGEPSDKLKSDIRSVLAYLDRLLESLPEEKIEEFAHSEHFDTYKKLFEELGLV